MSKNKSPLNESFLSEKTMSEMLPMNLKVSQSKLNYEEKVYIPPLFVIENNIALEDFSIYCIVSNHYVNYTFNTVFLFSKSFLF